MSFFEPSHGFMFKEVFIELNFIFWLLLAGSVLSGCSSMERSIGLGIGSGIVLGAGSGALVDGHNKHHMAIQGAVVGGVLGGVVSYFIQRKFEMKEVEVRKETLFNLEKFNVLSPLKRGRKSNLKKTFTQTNEDDE